MTQENPNTPDTSEEVQASAEEQGTTETEASPVLNRAQRRAQARGKATPDAGSGPGSHQGGSIPSAGNRAGGHAGQVRFPRTGHK